MQFRDIPGLIDEKSRLIASVQKNHMAHAQLFNGPEGSANLSLALAFITYINCDKPGDTDSCGACPSCSKMAKLVHPDVTFAFPIADIPNKDFKEVVCKNYLKWWRPFLVEQPYGNLLDWTRHFGAESKQAIIYREESRQIISALSLKAFEGRYKAMLIWQPEKMNVQAANALLKIVEEPPENTFFFFISNNYEAIINTIISRTQLVSIRGFTDDEVADYLVKTAEVDAAKAQSVARLAAGNMNLALSLLNEVEDESTTIFREWMRICWSSDFEGMAGLTDKFNGMSKMAQRSLLEYGLTIFRESLIVNAGEASLQRTMPHEEEFVSKFAKSISLPIIESASRLLNDSIYHLERNANPRILFMDLSLQMAGLLRTGVIQYQ
ncbi:MAG: DNA polymerase III subunit delta [Imperialibacter sp.]|uniref:DNA polymerase III subunit n=1 Tax=Imperialibacter sp. TaxID=2038411 RepID=UPI0032ED5F0B